MIETFVNSLVFTYRGDSREIEDLTRKCKFMNIDGENKCLDHAERGLILKIVKCKNKGNGNRKIVITADPNKLVDDHQITTNIDIFDFYVTLDNLIRQIMPDLTISDFKLKRMDIVRDMYNIPENIGQEYIKIMRKISLKQNFRLNIEPEDLRCKERFSAIDDNGVEFLVYNKRKEAVEENHSRETENAMRIELRCSKTLIRDLTKGHDLKESIKLMLGSGEIILNNFYERVFKYGTDLCYISSDWQKKLINSKYNKSVCKKLLKITKDMGCDNSDLDRVLHDHYSDRSKDERLNEFKEPGFSPIPIASDRISFMPPLDIVLGFCDDYTYKELAGIACYKKIKHSTDNDKEIFEYDPFKGQPELLCLK